MAGGGPKVRDPRPEAEAEAGVRDSRSRYQSVGIGVDDFVYFAFEIEIVDLFFFPLGGGVWISREAGARTANRTVSPQYRRLPCNAEPYTNAMLHKFKSVLGARKRERGVSSPPSRGHWHCHPLLPYSRSLCSLICLASNSLAC